MDNLDLYNKGGRFALEALSEEYSVGDDVATALALAKKGDTVLDLACGYGRVTIPLAQRSISVVGIDASPVMIKEAKKAAKDASLRIPFVVGDMRDLPYESESFSLVLCFWNSFNYLLTKTDQKKCIAEIHRVLKKGGRALVVVFDGETKANRQKVESTGTGVDRRIVVNTYVGYSDKFYIHDRASLAKVCTTAPFSKVEVKLRKMNKRRRIVANLVK